MGAFDPRLAPLHEDAHRLETIQLTTSEQVAERISILTGVAKSHGSLISLQELILLLPEPTSEAELAESISSNPALNSRFELREGFVIEKSDETGGGTNLIDDCYGRTTAKTNMKHALRFATLLRSDSIKMIAVSGSTSYRSASLSRDLDLFFIAAAGKMWLCLTQGLILARFFRFLNRDAPQICFSCVMDEDYAESTFTSPQDPLFARDALTAKVLKGKAGYHSLLRRSGWMASLYPAAYSVAARGEALDQKVSNGPTMTAGLLNKFLLHAVGGYIRTKSRLLNRRLLSSGQDDDLFVVRSGGDHLFHESKRYLNLKRRYSLAGSGFGVHAPSAPTPSWSPNSSVTHLGSSAEQS
jgi:hypothetical protein